jgi:TrmH family RNA methyltransferase
VRPHTSADLSGRLAIVMGNEAAGLPDEWTDTTGPIRRWVTIPHRGRSESLNVAMAATVLLFEAARQRDGDRSTTRY